MSPEHHVLSEPRGYKGGGGCGGGVAPPSFPLCFSSLLFSMFSFYLYLFLVKPQYNSPYLIVWVKLIACPPNVFVALLQNNYSQGLTIWGTVSHSEDTGGEHTCGESLIGWLSLSEMTHSCSACADKEGRRPFRSRRKLPLKLILFSLSPMSWLLEEKHLMPRMAVTKAKQRVLTF